MRPKSVVLIALAFDDYPGALKKQTYSGAKMYIIQKLGLGIFLVIVLVILFLHEPVTALLVAAISVLLFLLLRKPNGGPSRENEDDRLY